MTTYVHVFTQFTEKATSTQIKPMQKPVRLLLHSLAKYYNVNSYEYDPEPNRYISFVKLLNSKLPCHLLSHRCTSKRFHRDFTIFQLPDDADYPFTLCFCRKILELGSNKNTNDCSGEDNNQNSSVYSNNMNRMMESSIPSLTSASELLLRIQLCNGNKRFLDSKLDSSYSNAFIIHFKSKVEAISVFDGCANDKAICLRYSIEHRGWAESVEPLLSDVQGDCVDNGGIANVEDMNTYTSNNHGQETSTASWEHHMSLPPSRDAFFEDDDIVNMPSFFKEVVNSSRGADYSTMSAYTQRKLSVDLDEADLIDAGFEAVDQDQDKDEKQRTEDVL